MKPMTDEQKQDANTFFQSQCDKIMEVHRSIESASRKSVVENHEEEDYQELARKADELLPPTGNRIALKKCCTHGILDRAILCGLGMSADSANIVMEHIEELRAEIKRLKSILDNG